MESQLSPGSKVLVTGANGFVGIYVSQSLLKEGYAVRGTVRSAAKGNHLKKVFAEYGNRFEIAVVEDISKTGAFDEALKGVDAIQHTASPSSAKAPRDMITPAVKGTVGILESAVAQGNIRSVVITSSIVTITNFTDKGCFDESRWNLDSIELAKNLHPGELSWGEKMLVYTASKTSAEKAAWDFYEQNKDRIQWTLATVCPSVALGPILQEATKPDDMNDSMEFIWNAVWCHQPRDKWLVPEFSWIDVRDMGLAHVRAMERTQAAGKRFIVSYEFSTWEYWIELSKGNKPSKPAPRPESVTYDNSSLRNVLGIELTEAAITLKDITADFRQKGWIS